MPLYRKSWLRPSTKNCHGINLTPEEEESFRLPDLNNARSEHCALSIGDKVFVFGGANGGAKAMASIECSDGIGNWTMKGNLCEKRFYVLSAIDI